MILILTDKQIQAIRSRFSIFQHKIYLNRCFQGLRSDAVQTGVEEYLASWHEHQISFHVYNMMDDVRAVAEVLQEDINLLVLDPASVGGYD